MDEQQFVRRLLELLNRNPNINLNDYFRNDPQLQELIRITQFRHYRASDRQEILKLLIPALIESVGMSVPSLIETKEIFIPALIEITKADYGLVSVLFGKFKFYNSFPEDLCTCKKWMPTSNGCVLTCNGEGMFDTQQECENFRNTGSPHGGNPEEPIKFYYAVKNFGDTWLAGRLQNAYEEYGPSSNLFVAKAGNIKLTGQLYNPMEPDDALKVTWTGENGGSFFNHEVDLYYVGAEKYYRLGNFFDFQLELNSSGYLGVGGAVSSDPRSQFKSINFCWPENPIDKWDLAGAKTFTQSVDPTLWLYRGELLGYEVLQADSIMPVFPTSPNPYPSDDNGNYWGLELFLGGDREVPISLGEFLINASPIPSSVQSVEKAVEIKDEEMSWYQEGNLLLPDWMQFDLPTKTIRYEGGDKNKLNNLNLRYWSEIPNIRSYAVKLSETETEVVVKYSTFRKFKRISSGTVLYDIMWCQIAVIKVSRGNIERKNFKYPETVECDPRNWAAPYFKNWYCSQIPDESPGALPEHRLDQYSDTEISYNPFSGSPARGFFYIKTGYGQFAFPEMAKYLFANTLQLREWIGQNWEVFAYPLNPQAMHTKGVNFNVSNNKLCAWDIKPNQSIEIEKNSRSYILPLLDAIKFSSVDAYIKYGELKRPEVVEGGYDNYQEFEYFYPVPYFALYNDEYLDNRNFSFKPNPKIAKTKIYKIPDDCFVIEATAFVDPVKLETSSIVLPPQLYQSVFQYSGPYEGDAPIEVLVQWLDNNWPTAFEALTPIQKYFLETTITSLAPIYNREDGQPTILFACGNNQTSLPPRSGPQFDGYRPRNNVILRGYCP